jgi:hypothetical protein
MNFIARSPPERLRCRFSAALHDCAERRSY